MKLYWPCAIILISDNDEIGTDKISTYDGEFDIEKAKAQIDMWKFGYDYDIQEAWIDVYENGQKVERIDVINE